MFEKYMDHTGIAKFSATLNDSVDVISPSSRVRSWQPTKISEVPNVNVPSQLVRLSAERKCKIAHQEQAEAKKEIAFLIKSSENLINEYKARIEQLLRETEDIAKERRSFSNLVVRVVNTSVGRHHGHRTFLSFHQNYLRRKDDCIRNMLLENEQFRSNLRRLSRQLLREKSSNEATLPVDLEELQIKICARMRQAREINSRCMTAKCFSNYCTHNCSVQKVQLDKALVEKQRLVKATERVLSMVKRVEHRIRAYSDLHLEEWHEKHCLRANMETFRVPTVSDFIHCVKQNEELTKKLVVHNRKLRIAKLSLDAHKKAWSQIKRYNPK
ncbi:unnamed protein product [Dicrocoelium dendriticum]|nr:unnamed protein product [Dicrocoelium dendriticum]